MRNQSSFIIAAILILSSATASAASDCTAINSRFTKKRSYPASQDSRFNCHCPHPWRYTSSNIARSSATSGAVTATTHLLQLRTAPPSRPPS